MRLCDAYLKAVAECSLHVPPATRVRLELDLRRHCADATCGDALLDLVDEPACQSVAATALLLDLFPTRRQRCGTPRRGAFTADPGGPVELRVRSQITAATPSGVVAVAVDGVPLVITSVGPSAAPGGILGAVSGRLDPGPHFIAMMVRLRESPPFDGLHSGEGRCLTVAEGAPLRVEAVLADSTRPLAVVLPVQAHLDVR